MSYQTGYSTKGPQHDGSTAIAFADDHVCLRYGDGYSVVRLETGRREGHVSFAAMRDYWRACIAVADARTFHMELLTPEETAAL